MYTLDDIKKKILRLRAPSQMSLSARTATSSLLLENWVSPAVMSAMGSILTNKYAEDIQEEDTMAAVSAWTR